MKRKDARKKQLNPLSLHAQTRMMSEGYDPFLSEGSVKPPVFLTSTFAFRTAEEGAHFFDVASGRAKLPEGKSAGLVYSRFNNPNLEIAETRLAVLDGSEAAVLTSSGMAAISAVMLAFLRPGDQIVCSTPLYGGTQTLISDRLPLLGMQGHVMGDGLSADAVAAVLEQAAAQGPVRMVYVETPGNPTNALVDLKMLHEQLDAFEAKYSYRPISVCDNTMLGPIFQQPTALGVDLSVYSLTKYVGGHSDLVAGAVTGPRELLTAVRATRGAFGMQLDPHSAWMLTRSMETVTLRMHQAATTASAVARWLQDNPYQKVLVHHPECNQDERYQAVYTQQCTGPGSTFSFVLEGGREQAFALVNSLQLFQLAVSLGGTESLVCHPASTTHSGVSEAEREAVGVSEGLIRLSIGLEHAGDLIADLDQAFAGLSKNA